MIPVSIVTGFLGSGKTTLIGRILRDPAFARTAVIVNEFGEIGLDHTLIASANESLMALTTGCLCCAIQGDLVRTLLELRATQADAYDRVLIETSGLADPAPILHALMTMPDLIARLAPAIVVTTVDAVTGAATLAAEPVSRKQVAVADRLIITKADLADVDAKDLGAELDGLNAAAPRRAVVGGKIDPADLFTASPLAATIDPMALPPVSPESTHRDGISAHVVMRDTPLRAVALTLFLEALAEHCGGDILRMKGLVAIAEAPDQPAVVHGVQHVFHPLSWLAAWPSADRRTRLVFITRRVPGVWLNALLAAIEAEVADIEPMR